MNLKEVSFPVFPLRRGEPPIQEAGVVYYEDHMYHPDKGEWHDYYVVDDLNVKGDSLAVRRLVMMAREDRLFKLKMAIYFLADLIKLAKPNSWYIDYTGRVFQYQKSKWGQLTFRRINKVIPIETGGALLEVEGSPTRYKTLFAPTPDKTVAGLLRVSGGYILYGLYDEMYDNTKRKL